jgi:hypothetical protein
MIPRPPDELTLTAIGAEVMRARVKLLEVIAELRVELTNERLRRP